MRKQSAAARRLPTQRRSHGVRIDGHKHQLDSARKMPCDGLLGLFGGREVNETVANIHSRARKDAFGIGFFPLRRRQNLIDDLHCHSCNMRLSSSSSSFSAELV